MQLLPARGILSLPKPSNASRITQVSSFGKRNGVSFCNQLSRKDLDFARTLCLTHCYISDSIEFLERIVEEYPFYLWLTFLPFRQLHSSLTSRCSYERFQVVAALVGRVLLPILREQGTETKARHLHRAVEWVEANRSSAYDQECEWKRTP